MSYRTMQYPQARHSFEALDVVVIGFMLMLVCVCGIFSDRLPDPRAPVVAFATVLVCWIALARILNRIQAAPGISLLVRSVALCVAFPYAFMHMNMVVEFINPFRGEMALMSIDRFMFGGHSPNVLLQDLLWPPAVDFFQMAYLLYYPLFLVLLVLLPFREYQRLAAYLVSVGLLFSITFIGYMLVPARSPYLIAHMPEFASVVGLSHDVQGGQIGMLIRHTLHDVEALKFDCFPSGHCGGATLVFLSLFSWNKRAGLIALPFCLALIFSTIYLQYHYVIDMVVGMALAVVVFFLGRYIVERFPYAAEGPRSQK